MGTEIDVSKSRRFDIAMSRRTRRSTSLIACFQDQYLPTLTQHRYQDDKLKVLFQRQDAELQIPQQCEDAEQLTPCLYEEEVLKILQAPLQYEDEELKTPKEDQDEQKESQQYSDDEQKKPGQCQDEQEKIPEQYLDGVKPTEQYQDEDDKTQYKVEYQVKPKQNEEAPEQHQDDEEAPEQHQDEEHKAPQERQEVEEKASEKYDEEEEEEQVQQQDCCNMEQKAPEQCQDVKNLTTPPCAVNDVPRFSLQELIQGKKLPTGEAKSANNLGDHGKNVLSDRKVPGSGGAQTGGGATLAMVIRRPEGGKKSMGMIRRCMQALNQMIKAKHGSKKNIHF